MQWLAGERPPGLASRVAADARSGVACELVAEAVLAVFVGAAPQPGTASWLQT
jgi:hypothetical protein